MANIFNAYDAEAEAQSDFSALPSGEYLAQIVNSEMKPTKNNDGEYLELEYEIKDSQYLGRKVWSRINLSSPNEQARTIANREFASVRAATGVANPRDSQELHYKPHIIRVEMIPAGTVDKKGYKSTRDKNEVKAWKKAEGVVATNTQIAPTQTNTAAPATGATPPWAQRAA